MLPDEVVSPITWNKIKIRVAPIFKDNNLLTQNVQMEAQSVGDDSIKFNVFIIQDGVKSNYLDETSNIR